MNGKLQPFSKIERSENGPQVIGVTAYVNLPPDQKPTGHPVDRERWENDEYHIFLDKYCSHGMEKVKVWELSILRKDGQPANDWRDLQAIKTAMIGAEFEALELYPAESRVIDVANETHLFAVLTEDGKPVRVSVGRAGRREINSIMAGQRALPWQQ